MMERIDIVYEGFEISVQPFYEYGPPPPNPRFVYSAYICRPGNSDSKEGGQKVIYAQSLPTFASEAEALVAGQQKGREIVDGADPFNSVKDL